MAGGKAADHENKGDARDHKCAARMGQAVFFCDQRQERCRGEKHQAQREVHENNEGVDDETIWGSRAGCAFGDAGVNH